MLKTCSVARRAASCISLFPEMNDSGCASRSEDNWWNGVGNGRSSGLVMVQDVRNGGCRKCPCFGTIYKYFSRSLLGRVIIKKHRSLTARTITLHDIPCICLDSSDTVGRRFDTYTSYWLLMLLAFHPLSTRVLSSTQLLAAFHNPRLL